MDGRVQVYINYVSTFIDGLRWIFAFLPKKTALIWGCVDLTGVLSAVKMKNLHFLRQESTSIGVFVQPTSIPFTLLDVVHKY